MNDVTTIGPSTTATAPGTRALGTPGGAVPEGSAPQGRGPEATIPQRATLPCLDSLGVESRPLSPADFGALQGLLEEVAAADRNDWHVGGDTVSERLSLDGFDLERGTCAVLLGTELVAVGAVRFSTGNGLDGSMLYLGAVRPGHRGRGLDAGLLAWAEDAAVALHRRRYGTDPVSLLATCRPTDADTIELYRRCGFAPIRTFHRMVRPLDVPVPVPEVPAAIEVRHYAPELDEAARHLHNEAFSDNWAVHRFTPEAWRREVVKGPEFQPALSFVAVAEDSGEPVAFVVTTDPGAQDAVSGPREAYVSYLGTLRAHRHHGIATALLLKVLRAATAAGFGTVTLEVDSQNASQAIDLYLGAGFHPVTSVVTHSLPLQPQEQDRP